MSIMPLAKRHALQAGHPTSPKAVRLQGDPENAWHDWTRGSSAHRRGRRSEPRASRRHSPPPCLLHPHGHERHILPHPTTQETPHVALRHLCPRDRAAAWHLVSGNMPTNTATTPPSPNRWDTVRLEEGTRGPAREVVSDAGIPHWWRDHVDGQKGTTPKDNGGQNPMPRRPQPRSHESRPLRPIKPPAPGPEAATS